MVEPKDRARQFYPNGARRILRKAHYVQRSDSSGSTGPSSLVTEHEHPKANAILPLAFSVPFPQVAFHPLGGHARRLCVRPRPLRPRRPTLTMRPRSRTVMSSCSPPAALLPWSVVYGTRLPSETPTGGASSLSIGRTGTPRVSDGRSMPSGHSALCTQHSTRRLRRPTSHSHVPS